METKVKNEREEEFVKGYEALVAKTDFAWATYPMFIPAEDGSFKLVLQTQPLDLALQKLNKSFIQK